VLLDLATHHIDLLRFLTSDEVQSVSAVIESRRNESDFATIEMSFGLGTTASVTCSYADSFNDTVTVRGERGKLRVDRARSWDVEFIPAGRVMYGSRRRLPSLDQLRHVLRKLRSPFHEPSFETALTAFVDAIRSGGKFTPDLDDGIAALRVAEAARASAKSGMPIAIDTPDSDSRTSPAEQ
ncbi:MAG TPA: Gfo/Idh/MocA family oxidoreductase, partial [Gemmatimonadaceae bacterium]|nr:Gfo/Idh/MocA family oxidoreductase [Gemmatimonadaceae bacterium]